ncbi:hypothetical protein XBKB1_1300044 [Xenorhabdus bovienii str. kraussei Becker Underwood]|uniref:Uncharacterized protein n=1 Tax=Xenorhabdus bovienii str. kraussei Becker Underwood TaxID=1398204 RepID=A0A077PQG6_XENBV|nr:hypothetical protein XBKB1_1300044 [Xenorhabdus bovienii str. kraussei Becker Underwood]
MLCFFMSEFGFRVIIFAQENRKTGEERCAGMSGYIISN